MPALNPAASALILIGALALIPAFLPGPPPYKYLTIIYTAVFLASVAVGLHNP